MNEQQFMLLSAALLRPVRFKGSNSSRYEDYGLLGCDPM